MCSAGSVGEIVWVASYPKSGSTWLRALLTNYLLDTAEPADINRLIGHSAASRRLFDDEAGVKSSDLTLAEIERARPRVYECLARRCRQRVFLKIHDALVRTSGGEPLIPSAVTRCVLYLVRHPADVAESYAHHRGCSIDEAIELLADEQHRLADGALGVEGQLPQQLLSWSSHVAGWLDSGLPVEVVRYEDLSADPEACLTRVLQRLGEPCHPERVRRAVTFSCFQELSRQERDRGFHERPSAERRFFRAGVVGVGRRSLTRRQRRRVLEATKDVMLRLGYGEPADG